MDGRYMLHLRQKQYVPPDLTVRANVLKSIASAWNAGLCMSEYNEDLCRCCELEAECLEIIRDDLRAVRDYLLKEKHGRRVFNEEASRIAREEAERSVEGIFKNIGVEEGDLCSNCHVGRLVFGPVDNCSCHIDPPCHQCVENELVCDHCGEGQDA